ncbi:MAG: AraC family transcriptional regulator [Kurthia sp.]
MEQSSYFKIVIMKIDAREGSEPLNYHEDIKRSIEYIELHIKEDPKALDIAHNAGYSVFHFSRIFRLYYGTPLMDFVRKKRLIEARKELKSKRKIIDVAMDFGFQTASGFSKAFRKEFGYSPTVYISRSTETNFESILQDGNIMKTPTFIQKSSFKIAGYGIKTTQFEGNTKDIAAYWDTYTGENLESKMYAKLEPPNHGEVGISVTSEEGILTYLFGVIVDNYDKVTQEMMTFEVPEAQYAVFTTPPVNNIVTAATYDDDPLANSVKSTWQYIFEEWFETTDFVFDESKVDFEFYDERCHGLEDAVMEIYVPIKRRD